MRSNRKRENNVNTNQTPRVPVNNVLFTGRVPVNNLNLNINTLYRMQDPPIGEKKIIYSMWDPPKLEN